MDPRLGAILRSRVLTQMGFDRVPQERTPVVATQKLVFGESRLSGSADFEHLQRQKDDTIPKEQTRSSFDHMLGGARCREKRRYD